MRHANARRASSTLPAAHGGLRPFAVLPCNPLRRSWAPTHGVQACGSAPLTAQAPKCHAIPGAPVGCNSRSIRMHKAAGRRGKHCTVKSRTPEREIGTSADAPVPLPGSGGAGALAEARSLGRQPSAPNPRRAFGDFSRVRKVTPAERRSRRPQAAKLPGAWGISPNAQVLALCHPEC